MTKTVKGLAADVEGLQNALEKVVDYNTKLMETLHSCRDEIAQLQAANLAIMEGMKTITTYLAIDQQPGIKDILAGYQ